MASNIVIGEKTLQCNDKLMASDVVIEVGGEVTPTSETWVINTIPVLSPIMSVSVEFKSHENKYTSFVIKRNGPRGNAIAYDNINACYDEGWEIIWLDQAYRTITLDEPATGELLTWLQANAVKQ